MKTFYHIVSLLGGLALFLYGMRIMGDGLKKSSGGAMRSTLAKVTDKPFKGFILGVLVTCMIQSSTATIVLMVGLVGAGFLQFEQTIGVVMGANVGTAITAQIIRLMDVEAGEGSILYFFKSDNLAPMALILGIILIMFVKHRSADVAGTVCMGFGILFVGLMNMSNAVSSMSGSLSRILLSFEDNYILGFLSGALVTGIIQSSSAVIGIVQSVASSVGISFSAIFAVIIGVNIGDCLTTYLVCRIGAKPEQIRTCLIHIIYNVFAALFLFIGIGILRGSGVLNDSLWNMTLRSGGVANVHGLFRLIPAVLFLPAAGTFASIARKIVPDTDEEEEAEYFRQLDLHLITNPYLALAESRQLIGNMADVAIKNYRESVQQIFSYETARNDRILRNENLLDRMTDSVNQYIVSVAPYITLDSDNREQSFQLRAMTCFERIGDLAVNIAHNTDNLQKTEGSFSKSANEELQLITLVISDILELTSDAFHLSELTLAQRVEPLEEVVDDLIEELRERHLNRMLKGSCDVQCGIEYQNILVHLERISDQCSDLAVYLMGLTNDEILGREHQYLHNLHHSDDEEYQTRFHSNYLKYHHMLDEINPEE